jgi:glycosyltransferase involved in cell wall biosynthesis
MNYYFLPDRTIFGGIKVGFQFTQLLNELGAPCLVATPGGLAPDWFPVRAAVVSQEWALAHIGTSDRIVFSLPHDYVRLKARCTNLVFHCNGTDPLIEPIVADRGVAQLTCWQQATDYMRERGREPVEVGISISDAFFYAGLPKQEDTVCYMPRRGAELAARAARENAALSFAAIDGLSETAVAQIMQRSSFYLATSVGEGFGLPALEAMAAGCVVVSVPVVGGVEYLRPGTNCIVSAPHELPHELREISARTQGARRFSMRHGAAATAAAYRQSRQRARLRTLLEGPLAYLRQ